MYVIRFRPAPQALTKWGLSFGWQGALERSIIVGPGCKEHPNVPPVLVTICGRTQAARALLKDTSHAASQILQLNKLFATVTITTVVITSQYHTVAKPH